MHRLVVPPLALVVSLSIAVGLRGQGGGYDVLIRNARVVDGTGNAWFKADVAFRGDTIAAIAPQIDIQAARVIDAADQVLAPGFIDLHVHAIDVAAGAASAVLPILETPTAEQYIRQGVTTLITGPDGTSPLPLKPVLDQISAARLVPNLGTFVGHGSIRESVLGRENRPPTATELESMRRLVRVAMQDGAVGISTGLFYVPAAFAKTAEVIELAKIAGEAGGIHISHMRDEAQGVLDSVKETIRIGEEGGLPTQVTHHKAIGKLAWGNTVQTLRLIDEARQRGVDATMDVYPYTASSTSISAALIPAWAREGGSQAIAQRLKEQQTRRRILGEASRAILEERGGGDPHNIQISRCDWKPELAGMRLDEVAVARGLKPTVTDAADSALWIMDNGDCGAIFHAISEDDVQRVIRHPASMIASDGRVTVFGRAIPHPRGYGTFPRVLGRYVRELNVVSLEEAIRKMTSFPAQRIGLRERGLLRVGMKADAVIFNPRTVRDRATYDAPHQYAEGFAAVIVNGQVVFENGKMTGARPGRLLYGPGRAQ